MLELVTYAKLAEVLERCSGRVILGAVGLTLLLVVPLLAMDTDEVASSDPSGDVFDLQDDIDRRFQPVIHGNSFIAEARAGDMLTQAALWELYQNTQALVSADQRRELGPDNLPPQPYLYEIFDTDTNLSSMGVTSLADEVQRVLTNPIVGSSLESATDLEVKLAVYFLFSNPETSQLRDFLSINATQEKGEFEGREVDYWSSPGLIVNVLADNEKLGGGISRAGLGVDDVVLDKERFNRNVQKLLRGEERTYRLWGIAIDQNLEAEDEGETSGIYIMLTVIAAVGVVGLALRSYWAAALTGAGLGFLMIWLKGFSNLVGIEGGLVIDLIVPIAMVALGVDFAVHALRRYQEEKRLGYPPRRAMTGAFAGVMGALVLAMLSDGIAFLSNTSSGIEAVIHFGFAAGIAAVSSFLVLGVVVPLAMMRIDRLRRAERASGAARFVALSASTGVAVLSGTAVIFLVAVSIVAGLVVLLGTIVAFLVVPVLIMARKARQPHSHHASPEPQPAMAVEFRELVPVINLVSWLAQHRLPLLAIAGGVTAVSVVLALRLEPDLDVKDFFDGNSDFVVSLDKLDEHIGTRGGEPAVIYIEGDLVDPEVLAAVGGFLESLADNPYVGQEADGRPNVWEPNVLSMLERATGSDYARERIGEVSGVDISDLDGDGVPDTREQIQAVYSYAVQQGLPRDEETLVYSPGEVRTFLFHEPGTNMSQVAIWNVGIPDSREQTTLRAAREALTDQMEVLRQSGPITRFGVAGSPFIREGQLAATTKTLQRSLPIAASAALVLLLVAMRSVRYAVVTIIPIGLVVTWLYALMYLIRYDLNFVTATIGAISVGVGIDYSIHMTERFREELRRAGDKTAALRRAAAGTGVALLASGTSSIAGFTIMAFAPMPVVASFGILTALMIFLALAASLAVLPSLLMLVTPDDAQPRQGRGLT